MNRKIAVVGAGLALAVGVAACDNSNLTSLNQNPNSPESAPAGPLFTNATRSAVANFLGVGYNMRGTEFVTQQLAEVQYTDEDRYSRLTGGSTAGFFNNPYTGELEDFAKVIEKGKAQGWATVWGPATAMQVWEFGYLTNTWGDIPYSEALKGDSGIISPKYDPQQEIYTSFFARLDSVSQALDAAPIAGEVGLGSADPIYGDDPGQWQKFANSLRLRAAIQISYKDPATASTQIAAALAAPGGVFTSNGDNAVFAWPGDGIYNNPWAGSLKGRDDYRMSRTLMDILVGTNDPRVGIYAMPAQSDTIKDANGTKIACASTATCYAGMPNGITSTASYGWMPYSSRVGEAFFPGATAYGTYGGTGSSFPSFLLTYAEVEFDLAEAAERGLGGLTPAVAATHYYNGIRASMEQWGVSNADIVAFLAQPSITYVPGNTGLRQIATQKWIALFTDGGQAWAEWRRTCTPNTVVAGPAALVNYVPRRFQYSTTEVSVNAANLQEAIDRQGDDTFATRVWWDTGTNALTCP